MLQRVLWPDVVPTAGVVECRLIAEVTASCRGKMVFTKKSMAGNLMLMVGCSDDAV